MDKQEFEKLLEKLHAEMESVDRVDEKSLQLLRDLEKDIDELLSRSDNSSILERLRDSVREFEVSYPTITAMLSEISKILSNAGI